MCSPCPMGYVHVIEIALSIIYFRYHLFNDVCSFSSYVRSYCPMYANAPTPCPPGSYGSVTGLQTDTCSGICGLGSYCPLGSTAATPCPPGTYGSVNGLQTANCSGLCSAGIQMISPFILNMYYIFYIWSRIIFC